MLYLIRYYEGADNPQSSYDEIEVRSAKEAAEQVCGDLLVESGTPLRLRAMVHTQTPGNVPITFYARA